MFEHINCFETTWFFAEFGSGSRDEYKLRDKNLVLTKSIILLQMFSESACNFQASRKTPGLQREHFTLQ
jgi:hypothetical protein